MVAAAAYQQHGSISMAYGSAAAASWQQRLVCMYGVVTCISAVRQHQA